MRGNAQATEAAANDFVSVIVLIFFVVILIEVDR
jgi:hypothetical protein